MSDAGQELWEEVSIVRGGGNYGWNVREGRHCFNAQTPTAPLSDCPSVDPLGKPLIDPIIEYPNAKQGGLGYVAVGGYVYRGSQLPSFEGLYFFGDLTRDLEVPDGSLFVAGPSSDPSRWEMRELQVAAMAGGRIGEFVKSFGQEENGEVLVLTSDILGPTGNTGKIWRLVEMGQGD